MKPMKQTTIRGSQPKQFGRPAGVEMKYHQLSGKWAKVNGMNIDWCNTVELVGQNGFFAAHKLHKCTVFVVETGPKKGIWTRLDSPF